MLEWCEGTMPLSLYLTGPDSNSGAHVRYRPEDTSPSTCKHDLMQMQKKAANREELTKVSFAIRVLVSLHISVAVLPFTFAELLGAV